MTDTQNLAYIAEYLSIYLGAELKLLDNFLTTFFYTYSPNWMGYASFHFLYSWLGTKLDVPYWVQNNSTDLLDFGAVNQVLLGNVYTCFSIYFLDFGFFRNSNFTVYYGRYIWSSIFLYSIWFF